MLSILKIFCGAASFGSAHCVVAFVGAIVAAIISLSIRMLTEVIIGAPIIAGKFLFGHLFLQSLRLLLPLQINAAYRIATVICENLVYLNAILIVLFLTEFWSASRII